MNSSAELFFVWCLLLTLSRHAAESVDSYFRSIASGSDAERRKAIHALLHHTGETKNDTVIHYVYGVFVDGNLQPPSLENYKVLLRAVSELIEILRTNQREEAWRLLIYVTNFYPNTTDHDVWLKWWEADGRKFFTEMANRK